MRRGQPAGSGRPTTPTKTRFWFDPRFGLGLVLVVASIVGVSVVVAGSDRTVAVYAARVSLAVGDRLDAADLVETDVRLGAAGELYLTPARIPADGLVVTRTVTAGGLVTASPAREPTAAAGTSSPAVTVRVTTRPSAGMRAGVR